jgi:site-specific DNA-adenine methylase
MKKSSNLISRLGNKEIDLKHFKHLLPTNCLNIVEPFGGTFAIIRLFYYEDKYNKYVNDSDYNLYYRYINIDEVKRLTIEWDKIGHKVTTNHKLFAEEWDKIEGDEIIKQEINKARTVRGSYKKYNRKNNYDGTIFKKINFSNDDYKSVIEKFKTDENAFIFLDPPYLFSDNSGYFSQNKETDMTDILIYIKELLEDKNTKSKIMMVINKLNIIKYLFNDFIKLEYNKTYSLTKKTCVHYVMTNF